MTKLRETYLLQYSDLVKVQITAYNIFGWGPASVSNTLGALV
jgi:hypothetical protein